MKTVVTWILFTVLARCAFGQNFQSTHFTVEKLADGVYAAIAKNGGYAICNAGIIDLGDATLIFDAFMTPEAAKDLKQVAAELTGSPVKYVVNSHYHNDHVSGDQIFADATLISTSRTRELIAQHQPEEIEYYKTIAPQRLENFSSANTAEMTAHQRDENIMWKGYFEALVTSLDELKMTLPELTIEQHLTLHGTARDAQLLSYGAAHTESDLFLYLPEAQIAFLGDLLFIQNHPWLGDGNPDQWKVYLDSIALLPLNKVVPGHGPVGTLADFEVMKSYIDNITETAVSYFTNGTLPENDQALKTPPLFENWFLSRFFRPNVINEYERLYKTTK